MRNQGFGAGARRQPGGVRVILLAAALAALVAGAGCGDDGGALPDAAPADAAPSNVTTDHCTYQPMTATARAGGTMAPGALSAGAAERVLDVPVGTALGGYTGRAGFLGDAGEVDLRKNAWSGSFNPSVGVVTRPRAKALALTTDGAGGDTVIIVKVDAIFAYEGLLFDLEERLGADFAGKVLYATSHSHSAWAQHTGHSALKLGSGELRAVVYDRVLAGMEAAARAALAARVPARLGVFSTDAFDPGNTITRDRRGENNDLMGGPRKDDRMFLIRVDNAAGDPIAAVPIYGVHGTINDQDNPLATTEAAGAAERMLETRLPIDVVVMHLQSAGADTSPTPRGGVDCAVEPGRPSDPCFSWTTEEGHGQAAAAQLLAAWEQAGEGMQDTLALEMVTRSVELGPDPATFTIRDGALAYAPFDLGRLPDGQVFDGSGNLISPIDEFNAPVGAALCETDTPTFPAAVIPGAEGIVPYGSCQLLDVAGDILEQVFRIPFEVTPTGPICQSTRTNLSALRLGDHVIGTLPGEVSVLIADKVRATSPVAAANTIVVGYAQGHVGYLMAPEDWALGGYEPSVTFWGPLEAEYLAEQLADLMPAVMTPAREDGTTGGRDRLATARATDDLPIDDPAPMAGTVATTPPGFIWLRSGTPTTGQPAPTVSRLSGIATFVWNGDDPLVKTPVVRVERETAPSVWAPLTRAGGRVVEDGEVVLAYTPQPLRRMTGMPQIHTWAVEFQAVSPWSAAAAARPGNLPLGRYRFHVEGDGWTLDSDPFEVVGGGLEASATRPSATSARVTVTIHAPRGWRLLDPALPSNRPVPLRATAITVAFLGASGNVLATATGTTDAGGVATVDGGAAATGATQVRVTDADGNVAPPAAL
ncbi:MAG: hypothetical protein KA190_22705 [Kofleriaceae bacterium]|nr:hypothetical protein [Kofleriaceae bacterium]